MLALTSRIYLAQIGKKKRVFAQGITDIEGQWNFDSEPLSLVVYSGAFPADRASMIATLLPCSKSEAKRLIKNDVRFEISETSMTVNNILIHGIPLIAVRSVDYKPSLADLAGIDTDDQPVV